MDHVLMPHASVRLYKLSENNWRLSHLLDKKEYNVEAFISAVITLFSGGESISSFFRKAKNIMVELNEDKTKKLIEYLLEKNILVKKDNAENQLIKNLIQKWQKYGWSEAADYYISSLSYPFVEGTVSQYNQDDSKRMSSYYSKEPDLNRSKDYDGSKIVLANTVSKTLESSDFSINLAQALNEPYKIDRKMTIEKNDVLTIASIAFGKFKSRKNNIDDVADAVRKTSPSGGSRHPTEGYIIVNDHVNELDKGVYHFSVSKNALEMINGEVSQDDLIHCFPGLFRKNCPKIIIVLSSLFERNMYRYREPRTFRSIFIDAGHVAETIRLTSQALGLKYCAHTYISFSKTEEMLKLNSLKEGVLYSVGVY